MTAADHTALLRWIVFVPLGAALVQGVMLALVRRSLSRGLVVALSCGSVLTSFGFTCLSFAELVSLDEQTRFLLDTVYTWIGVGIGDARFSADLAFRFDSLSAVMCLLVSGVGFLIHVYSVGYMEQDHRDDGGFARFFCYLNLFTASMLVLVLADNLLVLFLGWEGVGLCSYLLIGFWYSDRENAYAGSKAFILNRIGDFGFLIGLFLLFWSLAEAGVPTVSIRAIEAAFPKIAELTLAAPAWLGGFEVGLPTAVGACFFLGACGKSAQLPLHVWLPDAMAGPTPVSALIHAATMVTAGVYLIARLSFLYAAAPGASALIAWTGALTALFAAVVAINQNDIKKVLAYSTMSQLGLMFLAAGCGAYTAAIFHLATHAFFKALLFMGAGAVIVALDHEQDMRRMGGLASRLPFTHVVMAIGVAAIAGVPLFSGFFSKEEILLAAFLEHDVTGYSLLYVVALLTALLTAFYISRLFFLTFHGASRVAPELRDQLADPSSWMRWPLYLLAVLAVFGGAFGLPQFWGDMLGVARSDSLGNFLASSVVGAPPHEIEVGTEWALVGAALIATLFGMWIAFRIYVRRPRLARRLAARLRLFYRASSNKFWVDEIYDALFVRPLVYFAEHILYRGIDARLIDQVAVEGSARAVRGVATHALKYLQSGLTQGYLLLMIVGVIAIVGYLVG